MLPDAYSAIQPVFVICGVIVQQSSLINLTHDFIGIKRKLFPNVFSKMRYMECIKEEIKGSDIRKSIKKSRNKKRHALKFIDEVMKVLENYGAVILGRVWIKPIANPFNGRAVYTSSVQNIASGFQSFLAERDKYGIVVADSRTKEKNAIVSHSIFTQKYKHSGDSYDRILEMPVYGHSDNHAGIQLADLITSAIIFPISTIVYCSGHVMNRTHYHPHFLEIRKMFGPRLEGLQYRYKDLTGRLKGGITVSDPLTCRGGSKLFRP